MKKSKTNEPTEINSGAEQTAEKSKNGFGKSAETEDFTQREFTTENVVVDSGEGTLVEENAENVVVDSGEGTILGEVAAERAVIEGDEGTLVEENAESITQEKTGKRKRRRKRLKFYEITHENDMKYRGPLSYRYLRIAGWLFMIASQIVALWALAGKVDVKHAPSDITRSVFEMFGEMMMPLFLIATFATILNGSKSFKSMLTLYGGASVLFYILFIIVHERYIAGSVSSILNIDHGTAVKIVDELLTQFNKGGFIAFNIFIDLFLCTLLAFFVIYEPKKIFVDKKLIWFRCFALFPILYEVASFTIKILAAYGTIELSSYMYPLMTTKPPMTFIVYVFLLLFLKVRERIYRKKGGTHEQYETFLQTNANSWRFSSFTAKIVFIAGIIDILVFFGMTLAMMSRMMNIAAIAEGGEAEIGDAMLKAFDVLTKCGVGECGTLILIAPLLLLFSYTRTHKNTKFDTILPVIAIIVVIIVYIEGLYHVIVKLGDKLPEVLQNLIGKSGGV